MTQEAVCDYYIVSTPSATHKGGVLSIEHMSYVWSSFDGDPTAKLVLLSLADQANNDGWCWPSQAHTAKRCLISDRQLRTWLSRLADQGLIEVHKRSGKSDMYRVLTPEADFHPPRKPTSAHLGSPLPTNHKEPSINISKAQCPYCHKKFDTNKPHNCSAMNQLIR